MPAGYRVEYGGQFESEQSASQRLLLLGVGVVVGIFMLLVLAFGGSRDALLVMLNLPLALIGGVAGVFLAGGVLSVASLIGFITLFGIATRNGIMLVSHIQHLMRDEGVTDFREAVERGALERLIPILMTALAAGLALIPLALGGGKPGSEIQTPMAIVILCGLMTSTLLNMSWCRRCTCGSGDWRRKPGAGSRKALWRKTRHEEAGHDLGARSGAVERQQAPADDHSGPRAQRHRGDHFRVPRRVQHGGVAERLTIGRQIEEPRVGAADREEQQLEVERDVVDVLVGLGQEEERAGRGVEGEAGDAPRNEAVHDGDWHPSGHPEQAQVEGADAAHQHGEAEEVETLGDRPAPRRAHHPGHRRVVPDRRHEPDLEIVDHWKSVAVSRLWV